MTLWSFKTISLSVEFALLRSRWHHSSIFSKCGVASIKVHVLHYDIVTLPGLYVVIIRIFRRNEVRFLAKPWCHHIHQVLECAATKWRKWNWSEHFPFSSSAKQITMQTYIWLSKSLSMLPLTLIFDLYHWPWHSMRLSHRKLMYTKYMYIDDPTTILPTRSKLTSQCNIVIIM